MSHDQSFLDNICTDVIHLDMEKLFYYKGNYTQFKKMLIMKRKEQLKEFEKQERRIKEMKAGGVSTKKAQSKQKEFLTRKQEKNMKNKGIFLTSWFCFVRFRAIGMSVRPQKAFFYIN